jgi:Fe2+ transport system protein B
VYATRTLENEKDRILTRCGTLYELRARLPVYVLFASIFFPAQVGLVIFALYLTGIVMAIGVGLLLRKSLFAPVKPPLSHRTAALSLAQSQIHPLLRVGTHLSFLRNAGH